MSKSPHQIIPALVHSMRLRTLPLSLAGVVLGTFLAARDTDLSAIAAIFLFLTTISLQILSNLSNELGDFLSGTDTGNRNGPAYSMQNNELGVPEMKKAITVMALLCAVFGTLMILFSFGTLLATEPMALLALGAAAIWAAIRYTLGRNPYGYRGFGDISVFIFFGIVSVGGSYFVLTHTLSPIVLLPAATIGFFSVGVLNVNNLRDMESDKATRTTLPLKIGERNAKIYHFFLIFSGWICMTIYLVLTYNSLWNILFIITLPLFIRHTAGVLTRAGSNLDPMLPLLVLSTFTFSILSGIGFLL